MRNRGLLVLTALILAAAGAGVLWLKSPEKPDPPPAPSSEDPAAAARSLPAPLSEIVTAYRKIIVLFEDESALQEPEREKAAVVGKIIFHENLQRLAELSAGLTENLERSNAAGAASPAIEVENFLDHLERSPDLHDADKLVFRDVLGDLAAFLRDSSSLSESGKSLLARIEEDTRALAEIQSLYDRELERIMGRFAKRGLVVRREAWESYVAYLKTRFRPAEILKEYEEATRNIVEQRGEKKRESSLETWGRDLPPKSLVLTFDDGPHPRYTDRILEVLRKYRIQPVFFQVGRNLGAIQGNSVKETRATGAARRVIAAGGTLANHSYSHALLPRLSDIEIAGEIDTTNRLIQKVFGFRAELFRPPYGAIDGKILAALQARKMKSVLWNIDSLDWADPVPKSIAARVLRSVEKEKRGIILFHDIHERTIQALPEILESLGKDGYRFLAWDQGGFVDRGSQPLAEAESPIQLAAPQPLYRESWAVIIGIDDYRNWPALSYAVNDARGIRELLIRKFRFKPENIVTLLNEEATREKILSVLGDTMAHPEIVQRDDRVFVFFAGHGTTRRLPTGRDIGYIVPVEADLINYQGKSISMTNFQDISESIPAKHVFYVMDSCYSGLALTRGAAASNNFLREITRRGARQMLTAGGANEQVADNGPNGHSIFTWTLIQGLEGRADLNGDGFITASELAAYVGPVVSSLSRQTPSFGSLAGSEGGEFVFELKHESEFLSELSTQLDEEAIQLNARLDSIRSEISAKQERNQRLRREIASAQSSLEKLNSSGRRVPADSSQKRNDRGMSLFKERRYEEALQEFLAATKLDPSNVLAANNAGYMYYKLERFEEAAQWFEKSTALNPRRAIAFANLGDAYFKLNRKSEARQAYERYLELVPGSEQAAGVRQKLASLN